MKKHLVSFATSNMKNSQKRLEESAYRFGFDVVHNFGPNDLDSDFIENNKEILNSFQNRGAGYWLWKPYVIKKILNLIDEGDILMYSDVGNEIVNDISPLINYVIKNNVMFFRVHSLSIKKFTKQYTLINLNMLDYFEDDIANAAFSLYKKNNFSLEVVNEWLDKCQNQCLINDDPCGYGRHDGFLDHRHDQSILSYVLHKYNIEMNKDPSIYGVSSINDDRPFGQGLIPKNRDFYGVLFNHDRKKY